MALSLRNIGRKLWETVTPQNEAALRAANASIADANRRIQAGGNRNFGVLGREPARQQFVQQNQVSRFSLPAATRGAVADTFTKPKAWISAPVNVGSFRGSGLAEDFINSPFKVGQGIARVGSGDIKGGLGQVATGLIEGPAGLIPVGRVAQVTGKGTRVLPKVTAGLRQGAKEGAVYGGLYGAGGVAEQGGSWGDIAKGGVVGAVTGGVAGGVGGAALPVAAAGARVGLKVAKATPRVASELQDKALSTPATRVNLKEQAILRDYSDMLVGANKAKGKEMSDLIGQAQQVGRKYNIDLTNGSPAQRLERSNAVLDSIGKQRAAVEQGGYAKVPSKKVVPDLNDQQRGFVNDYAEMLEGMDARDGVSINKATGTRATSNSPFYRQVYAEKGRPPTKAEWFEEARRQIESGKAAYGASEEYAGMAAKPKVTLKGSSKKPVSSEGSIAPEPRTFYHGTDDVFDFDKIQPGTKRIIDTTGVMGIKNGKQEFGNELGFSVTKDKTRATDYGKNVVEIGIKPEAKIAKAKDLPEVFKQFDDGKYFNQMDAVRLAKEKGFDGIDLDDLERQTPKPTKNQEIQVFNKDVLINPNAKPKVSLKEQPTAQTPVAALPEPKLPTGIAKSPNVFQKMFTSTRGELSQQGTGGTEAATRLQRMRAKSEIGQAQFLESIPTVNKLKKDEFVNFVDSLDALSRGEQPNMSPKLAQAVREWSENIPKVREAGVKAGIEVGDRGQFYFPRQYQDLLKTRDGFNVAVNHLVQTGKAPDVPTAIQQLQFMKREFSKPFGNLEHARETDLPGYDKSQQALINYIKGAFERIAKAEEFGPKGEIANQLVGRIGQEGFDASRAARNLKIAMGEVDQSTTGYRLSGGIRKFNALRSLGTAGVSNSTQLPVNTGTVAGIGRTVKGAVKTLASPKARAEARQAGVALDSSLANLANQALGTGGKISRNVAAPFFRQVEKFNRTATAVVGADWGNSLAKKAARGDANAERILREKLGVTGEIGNRLTRDQEIQASRGLVEISQFKVDPQDLPGWADSPIGRLVAQFRTFGYKQSKFMYNEVLREAVKGNVLPLTRFVTLAVPLGAGAQYVKSKIKGTEYTEPGENPFSQGAKAIAAVGGFGLPGSEGQNLYKSNQYGNLEGAVAGTLGGPTASFVTETANNISKATGGNLIPIAKQAVRSVPAVGSPIANRAFPKKDDPKQADPTFNPEGKTLEELNAQASIERKDIEKKAKPENRSLQQLSNGKYLYQTSDGFHETSDLDKARKDIAMDDFKKSDEKSRVIGDIHYYKTKDGTPKTQPKIAYDIQKDSAKNKLEMDRAYEAKDVGGWLAVADKEISNLLKKQTMYDPETEQEEIDKVQLQIENLLDKAEGYIAKGIGGKGGQGDGTRGDRKKGEFEKDLSSIYKYAVDLNAGGAIAKPKVSVRSAPKTTAKRSNSKPRVSIRKSRA